MQATAAGQANMAGWGVNLYSEAVRLSVHVAALLANFRQMNIPHPFELFALFRPQHHRHHPGAGKGIKV
jgi:hypothetical protein